MTRHIRIGTRGSQLALVQAERVKAELARNFPDIHYELVPIKTKGDQVTDTALSKIGDTGLFTHEIQKSLLAGAIDIAIHSLKDLPVLSPPGLTITGVIKRGDVRDVYLSANGPGLSDKPEKKIIGTSSLRRQAQILSLYPDVQVKNIRGNVQTRLKKLKEQNYDGILMAAAGIQRLGLESQITEYLDPEQFLPAVAQGIIGIECVEENKIIRNLVERINHPETWIEAVAERAFLRVLNGGCQTPIGCFSRQKGNSLHMTGAVFSLEGKTVIRQTLENSFHTPEQAGSLLAQKLLDAGGDELIRQCRFDSDPPAQNNGGIVR